MGNFTSYDDTGSLSNLHRDRVSNFVENQRMIAQNLEIAYGRVQLVNTLEQLEKTLAESKEQLAIWQKTASNDVNRIAKMQEVVKNLEGTLSRSPVYQEMLLKRKQQVR